MPIPHDYAEKVYAGVLGKLIGVYLGRPFEGWSHEDILSKLGEVDYYVHDRLGVPLVVTDDDISGTFTFIRALEDAGFDPALSARQIGESWLNYIIEERTILWWGGLGRSTEHTAFHRLKAGLEAPETGSLAMNGATVAEQIGAQIFIDGWAMVFPGDPDRAARFAAEAARVSHDGAAVDAAVMIAVMESLAFVESDINCLLDAGLKFIDASGIIAQLICDVRSWHSEGLDWKEGFAKIKEKYGYDRYGGGCHVVPNHALIIHALLHGNGDFQRSLMIVNTCGWDTDCNSGNLGCLLGIRSGMAAFKGGPDWLTPINDRMFLPTADGGSCIADASSAAAGLVKYGLRMQGEASAVRTATYTFPYPESTHGIQIALSERSPASLERTGKTVRFENLDSEDALRISLPTHFSEVETKMPGYALIGSPRVYAGQEVAFSMELSRDAGRFRAIGWCATRKADRIYCDGVEVGPGSFTVPVAMPSNIQNAICEVGVDLTPLTRSSGELVMREIDISGKPKGSLMTKDIWTTDSYDLWFWGGQAGMVSNNGRRVATTGCREWEGVGIAATLKSNLCDSIGVIVNYQGLRRYVGLHLDQDGLSLQAFGSKASFTDAVKLERGRRYEFKCWPEGDAVLASVDDVVLRLDDPPFRTGGIGLCVENGTLDFSDVRAYSR